MPSPYEQLQTLRSIRTALWCLLAIVVAVCCALAVKNTLSSSKKAAHSYSECVAYSATPEDC